ncbi:helix-turn-helix transcriptional regulator [Streptomyces sp. H39-C1]|uniref:helix-turn-helix transcriptional regulator n=1 Tax=Streptomyces sp. H39-C1 TaxID=3004355 RepID=UPI0022AF95DA|nr:helix-turn-helix domain-containing protein [Streptomyces sp. H39-C1]MCZ4103577.1 helix-turn-helix domain-containing protein [Streptomyces sp. H39-C1]
MHPKAPTTENSRPLHDEPSPGPLAGGWYTTEEIARLLRVDASSVRRWRTARPPQGPPFVRLSERVVMYGAGDVERWLADRRIDPAQAV